MSVFPRRVTAGDTVVFHVLVANEKTMPAHSSISLFVRKPTGELSTVVEGKEIIVPPVIYNYGRYESYFSYTVRKTDPPGRYDLRLDVLDSEGQKTSSMTKLIDYFMVDSLLATIDDEGTTSLKNLSDEPTPILLFYPDGVLTRALQPFEVFNVREVGRGNPILVSYANFCGVSRMQAVN